MSEQTQSRETFLKNLITRYVASRLSSLWYDGDSSVWAGNLREGYCIWKGDDGSEFIVCWNPKAILAAACVLESPRFPEADDGWDEEQLPSGKKRGLQFLNNPPDDVQVLYQQALHLFENEFVTAGFWSGNDTIEFSNADEEALASGLEYFVEFASDSVNFLTTKPNPDVGSLSQHFGFIDQLEGLAKLAYKIGNVAFLGNYKLNDVEKKIFAVDIPNQYDIIKARSNWLEYLNQQLSKIGIHLVCSFVIGLFLHVVEKI